MTPFLVFSALLAAAGAQALSKEGSALDRLRSGDAAQRERACAELARSADRGPRVYAALSLLMDRDLDERVRLAAAEAVITFPGDDPVGRARSFISSEPGAQTRLQFAAALSTEPAHRDDGDVTSLLTGLLADDPSPEVRRAVAVGLGRRGDRRALAAIRRAAENDGEKAVRVAARQAANALSVPVHVRPTPAFKPKPPKPDAVKGKDPCPDPWGWCECAPPIKRAPVCLRRADCRIKLDTLVQLGMPCTWNSLPLGSRN